MQYLDFNLVWQSPGIIIIDCSLAELVNNLPKIFSQLNTDFLSFTYWYNFSSLALLHLQQAGNHLIKPRIACVFVWRKKKLAFMYINLYKDQEVRQLYSEVLRQCLKTIK